MELELVSIMLEYVLWQFVTHIPELFFVLVWTGVVLLVAGIVRLVAWLIGRL